MEDNITMLKDGYYLFIYSEISPILNKVRTSKRHDHNMALFEKVGSKLTLVHHWEFERITGYKHHGIAFRNMEKAKNFINERLKEYSLSLNDMIVVMGTPEIETKSFKLDLSEKANVSMHSLFHLYSSLLSDTEVLERGDAISLAFDGGPDNVLDYDALRKNHFCGAVRKNKKTDVFPILSPGPYWAIVTERFKEPEGTLMALANAVEVKSLENFDDLPDYYTSVDKAKCEKAIDDIIDAIMSYKVEDMNIKHTGFDNKFSNNENKISMVMKIIQNQSMNKVAQLVKCLVKKYDLDTNKTALSVSGGFALNCITNTFLMNSFGFHSQMTIPCVNDSGISVGMGLFFFSNIAEVEFAFDTPYYGDRDNHRLLGVLEEYKNFIEHVDYTLEYVPDDIINEPIVWFDGRSESGPRALGNRSILANPANPESKDLLNKYKLRQWWRPVAPIVLEQEVNNWFEDSFKSPYMLNTFRVKNHQKHKIESVLHLDGTARIQTISKKENKVLFSIIEKIYEKTDIPIICNTSLNDRGEPIINTVEEALNFALRKGIRLAYFNGVRVTLYNHDEFKPNMPKSRNKNDFDSVADDEFASSFNPFNLSNQELKAYSFNHALSIYDISKEEDVRKIRRYLHLSENFTS